MNSIGIVRNVDELGRVVLPMELRESLGIKERDPLEIFVNGSEIILKKYEPDCIFCGDSIDITLYKGKKVCIKCKNDL